MDADGEPDCLCDHMWDDHNEDLACTVEGCICSYYEPAE